MDSIALYSIKGGVGKTTAAVNLAWLAASDGFETLLCDLDPQGAASWCFRVRPPRRWSARRLVRGRLQAAIRGTDYPRLDVLPADLSFRSLDVLLASRARASGRKPSSRLARVLAPLAEHYRLIVLDCPASLTLATVNVLRAARLVLVPIVPAPMAVAAYRSLREFHAGKDLESRLAGFFSMVDRRKKLHRETCAALRAEDGAILQTVIPCASQIEQMSVRREPLVAYRHASAAARAFESLWTEIKGLKEPGIGSTATSPV